MFYKEVEHEAMTDRLKAQHALVSKDAFIAKCRSSIDEAFKVEDLGLGRLDIEALMDKAVLEAKVSETHTNLVLKIQKSKTDEAKRKEVADKKKKTEEDEVLKKAPETIMTTIIEKVVDKKVEA